MQHFINAFMNSKRALLRALRSERALKREAVAFCLALPLSFILTQNWFERAILLGGLLIVIVVELLNTALEKLCDHLHPGHHDAIGYVKDLGSAAVFVSLVGCGVLWLTVLLR